MFFIQPLCNIYITKSCITWGFPLALIFLSNRKRLLCFCFFRSTNQAAICTCYTEMLSAIWYLCVVGAANQPDVKGKAQLLRDNVIIAGPLFGDVSPPDGVCLCSPSERSICSRLRWKDQQLLDSSSSAADNPVAVGLPLPNLAGDVGYTSTHPHLYLSHYHLHAHNHHHHHRQPSWTAREFASILKPHFGSHGRGNGESMGGKKRVKFADEWGLDLERTRFIIDLPHYDDDDWSLIAAADGPGIKLASVEEGSEEETTSGEWRTNFSQPAADYLGFREKLQANGIGLENVFVKHKDHRFMGTIKV